MEWPGVSWPNKTLGDFPLSGEDKVREGAGGRTRGQERMAHSCAGQRPPTGTPLLAPPHTADARSGPPGSSCVQSSPRPATVALSGNWVFADVIKMSSHWLRGP